MCVMRVLRSGASGWEWATPKGPSRLLVEGGRFAKKGLQDAVKQNGRPLRQSWGLEEWFVSTTGMTLPVSDTEEMERDEKLFLAAVGT